MSRDDEKKEPRYEVGYRRPPKDRQFKKGESGNPTGRPKRKPKPGQSLLEALLEQLDRPMTIEENGKTYEITTKEELVKQAIKALMAGNPRPLKALLAAEPLIARAEAEQKEDLSARDSLNEKLDKLAANMARANAPKKDDPSDAS